MQKTRFISILAVGLLLSNIALVAYIALNTERIQGRPQPPPPHGDPKKIIIERLHFDEGQVEEYKKLISAHRAEVVANDQQVRALKDELYHTLVDNNAGNRDSMIAAIVDLQRRIENVHYDHFLAIKKLCRPDQQRDFEELAPDLTRLFGPPPHKRD